ncbi:carbohydrate ABC transporter permease [Bauldia sp.]|uniref:carbohydrate ABC transporter permease n=1 Tax=Bauldia sp. TaxID=2575872 RepID=UPI003BA931F4
MSVAGVQANADGTAGAVPSVRLRRGQRRRSPFRRRLFPYLLVLPAVIYLLTITLYPGVYAIYQSFFHVRFNEWIPAGTENYQQLFQDREFWGALWNTLVIGGISLIVQCSLAMLLAYYAYRDPLIRGWRIIFLLPMLFMPSAVAFLWKLAFMDGRVVSDLLMRLGLVSQFIDFSGSVFNARLTLIVADVWQWTPFLFIIFVAGLQAQDREVEEAARLDGASWAAIFWNISLPMMKPVIAIAVILRGIDITTMFTNVFIMTSGTPGGTTETISYFIYRMGFKTFNFGYASAASAVMLIGTIITAQLLLKRFFRSGRA